MYVSDDEEPRKQLRSNMFSLSGTGFFGAVGRSINLGNFTIFISYNIYKKKLIYCLSKYQVVKLH